MASASYLQRTYIPPPDKSLTQASDQIDLDYNASPSQHHSIYSSPSDDASTSTGQQNKLSPENANMSLEQKPAPALPPKPSQGPPIYREPPTPPNHEEIVHPDICINSTVPFQQKTTGTLSPSQSLQSIERLDRPASRTHAWVQEHKSSGKLVGEKLSSLQRKLRSFLSQPNKPTEIEKTGTSIEEPQRPDVAAENWNLHSSSENPHRPRSCGPAGFNMNMQDQMNYISTSSFSSNTVALPLPQPPPPTNHNHHYRTFQTERHPFAAPSNLSEHEDATDPDQIRDTCNKFFVREQRISWTNYLNPRNSYSNNIKSTYDYDKLVPKEVIGKPSQDKRPETSINQQSNYDAATPFPNFSKALDISSKQRSTEQQRPPPQQTPQNSDGSYFAKRIQHYSMDNNAAQMEPKMPNAEIKDQQQPPIVDPAATDCGEVYKSSSESGRGTMHSSMHGSKSVAHSSCVSNLDTSIDSDHSASGVIWDQHNHKCPNQGEYSVRHIYETPNSAVSCRQAAEKEEDGGTSGSLSVTPPLPPLSPPPSDGGEETSAKLSSRAKYKLSLSASALNSSYGKSNEHQQKCDLPTSKTPGKKSGVRRTTSINQTSCRHRSAKTSHYTKSAAVSGHRLGISHSNCASRKCNNSSPLRHTRSQMVFPCYLDNPDVDLTSTTTGLDMESLLDEDDYSSDLSASTMEPNEASMIRKQLEGLENMYSEIRRLLGVKHANQATDIASSVDMSRHSRRKMAGSMSSLTARSSVSRSNTGFVDKRGFSEKRRSKECRSSSASKRLQRLESHVVTLARSVAHLSSEMRTQHVLVQELENMRQDVTWVQERLRLMQLAQGCHSGSGPARGQLPMQRDWDNFHKEVLELLDPSRARKLTKFFGDEPPLIRQFLKRLGYEKYATIFENEKIGIKELPYLTEERLQKMGIPMGPRIRILQEALSSCQQNQYKVYIV